jgi:hypothetical protein
MDDDIKAMIEAQMILAQDKGLRRFREEVQREYILTHFGPYIAETAEQIARQRRALVAERLRTKFRVIDTNEEKQG